jgi:hypothetical protein
MNLYMTTLFKSTDNVIGAPADNDVNKTDFETNDKPLATKVDEVSLMTTTFIINKTYTQFEALLSPPLTWADVKYIEDDRKYTCYLLTE